MGWLPRQLAYPSWLSALVIMTHQPSPTVTLWLIDTLTEGYDGIIAEI